MTYEEKLNELLLITIKHNASDLHISVARRPTIRVDSVLVSLSDEPVLSKEDAEGLVLALLDEDQKKRLSESKQVDLSYNFEDKARFRVNVYFQREFLAAALRLIPSRVRAIDELNLPPILHDFTTLRQGGK